MISYSYTSDNNPASSNPSKKSDSEKSLLLLSLEEKVNIEIFEWANFANNFIMSIFGEKDDFPPANQKFDLNLWRESSSLSKIIKIKKIKKSIDRKIFLMIFFVLFSSILFYFDRSYFLIIVALCILLINVLREKEIPQKPKILLIISIFLGIFSFIFLKSINYNIRDIFDKSFYIQTLGKYYLVLVTLILISFVLKSQSILIYIGVFLSLGILMIFLHRDVSKYILSKTFILLLIFIFAFLFLLFLNNSKNILCNYEKKLQGVI